MTMGSRRCSASGERPVGAARDAEGARDDSRERRECSAARIAKHLRYINTCQGLFPALVLERVVSPVCAARTRVVKMSVPRQARYARAPLTLETPDTLGLLELLLALRLLHL